VLTWPAATWLHARELRLREGDVPDAIYLVAGAKDQDRRIGAVTEYLESVPLFPLILVGNDWETGCWCRDEQRNLTAAEWAVRKMKSGIRNQGSGVSGGVLIVPGRFYGTDGEMQALAAYLQGRPGIRHIALVTAPFHSRRAVSRLREHLDRHAAVSVIDPAERWFDRAPWIVALELAKMLRDRLGWAQARFVSREGWCF